MTDMTPLSNTPASKPKPRPRPQVMKLTEAAAQRIQELTGRADSEIVGLRVGIKNGGCAGQSYTVEYAHEIRPTDEVVEDKGVKILVDPKAVLFLLGTEMDYKVDRMSAQFIFNNPNQVSACGCGESVQLTAAQRSSRCSAEPGPSRAKMGPGSAAHRCALRSVRGASIEMDRDFLIDLFSDFGPVTIRPMFSGFGISVDGVTFAMALRAGLHFRADEQTIPQYEAEGSKPFQYRTSTRTVTVGSYWQLPARLFDDPEELADWARAALAAAQRAALRKRPKPRKATKKAATKKTATKKAARPKKRAKAQAT